MGSALHSVCRLAFFFIKHLFEDGALACFIALFHPADISTAGGCGTRSDADADSTCKTANGENPSNSAAKFSRCECTSVKALSNPGDSAWQRAFLELATGNEGPREA